MKKKVRKRGDPCKVLILTQGAVLVNEAIIHRIGDDVVAIAVDMATKHGKVGCVLGGDSDEGPGMCLDLSESSIHYDEEKKGIDTEIAFPEFMGWEVWSADYSRYTLAICLYK